MADVPAGRCVNRKGFIAIHEEDDLIRELLERWLGEAGYAVSASADQAPCLVIANVPSPHRAQALIQSLRAVYAAPILALSGRFRRGLAGSAEAARRLGVRKVLPNPFNRKELLTAVAASLEDEG
jgi:DNA-binding response OmpR family regulator